jgi:hypothetical protein
MSKNKSAKDFNSSMPIPVWGRNQSYILQPRIKEPKREWLKRITQNKK